MHTQMSASQGQQGAQRARRRVTSASNSGRRRLLFGCSAAAVWWPGLATEAREEPPKQLALVCYPLWNWCDAIDSGTPYHHHHPSPQPPKTPHPPAGPHRGVVQVVQHHHGRVLGAAQRVKLIVVALAQAEECLRAPGGGEIARARGTRVRPDGSTRPGCEAGLRRAGAWTARVCAVGAWRRGVGGRWEAGRWAAVAPWRQWPHDAPCGCRRTRSPSPV